MIPGETSSNSPIAKVETPAAIQEFTQRLSDPQFTKLYSSWSNLMTLNKIPQNQQTRDVFVKIFDMHKDEKRTYHNTDHLEALVDEFTSFDENRDVNLDPESKSIILASIFFHDAVYHIPPQEGKPSNEEQSAALAVRDLKKLGFKSALVSKVENSIKATQKHKKQNDTATNYFLDMDMSILGTVAKDFNTYLRNLRPEWKHVPQKAWADKDNGRPGLFIKPTLESERIFHTAFFYDKYEAQARVNLAKEYADLTGEEVS